MALENLVGADKFISALVPANPTGGDDKREGDDHLRGIKNALKNTFPNLTGAVTATQGELSSVTGKVSKAGDTMTGTLNGDPVLTFGTGGTERVRIAANGNVGIGNPGPAHMLSMGDSTQSIITGLATAAPNGLSRWFASNGTFGIVMMMNNTGLPEYGLPSGMVGIASSDVSKPMGFCTGGAMRMLIQANGHVNINSQSDEGQLSIVYDKTLVSPAGFMLRASGSDTGANTIQFRNISSVTVGTIATTGAATAYNTSSDYRLKNITGPLIDSGARIDALQPKVGTWLADGTPYAGFLAHELQAVFPGSVTGAFDALNENGDIEPQQIFPGSPEIIATIVAELQSLRSRVATMGGELATLRAALHGA